MTTLGVPKLMAAQQGFTVVIGGEAHSPASGLTLKDQQKAEMEGKCGMGNVRRIQISVLDLVSLPGVPDPQVEVAVGPQWTGSSQEAKTGLETLQKASAATRHRETYFICLRQYK